MKMSREVIRAKPLAVQTVLKAYITKMALDDAKPDLERYGWKALEWWRRECQEAAFNGVSDEAEFARKVVLALKEQPGWKEILAEVNV